MTAGTWAAETARYRPAIEAWPDAIARGSAALAELGLTLPLADPPTRAEGIAINLVWFATISLQATGELADGARVEWSAGRMAMACLSIRLMLEFSGAMTMAAETAERLVGCDEETLTSVAVRVERLVGGARFPVALPWGGTTSTSAISVQTFIDSLEKRHAGAGDDYAFLSAGSHPCHFQQFYLHMAGGAGDNWANPIFAKHAHELLTRMVRIGDGATTGLAELAEQIARKLGPILNRRCV